MVSQWSSNFFKVDKPNFHSGNEKNQKFNVVIDAGDRNIDTIDSELMQKYETFFIYHKIRFSFFISDIEIENFHLNRFDLLMIFKNIVSIKQNCFLDSQFPVISFPCLKKITEMTECQG